jgi:hypothetical protein
MKKIIFIELIAFLQLSCSHKPEKEKITQFILYGHSGFNLIDSTKLIFDSTSFDIRAYFEIKEDSFIRIARRKWKKETEYFKNSKSDTSRFSNVLGKLETVNLHDTQYYPKPNSMYDGYYYTIHIYTSFNKRYKISYIPDCLPAELKRVHDLVLTIIHGCKEHSGKFPFNAILKTDAIEAFKSDLHPPPAPQQIRHAVY